MSSEPGAPTPITAFDLTSIVTGDDRADLSGPADYEALKKAAANGAAQAAANGGGGGAGGSGADGGGAGGSASDSGEGVDAAGRPTHSSTGALLDYTKKVPVRAATSVIMLRESPHLEVFVQHRVTTMDFAAGVVVFPGGRVDPEDVSLSDGVPLDAPDLDQHLKAWSQTDAVTVGIGSSLVDPESQPPAEKATPAEAAQGVRTLLACAIREVEEETGQRLEPRHMHPWANLVTPPGRSKRFDTYFFVTAGEELKQLNHQTTEATNSEWLGVDELLTGEEEGRFRLMRPTLALLTELQHIGNLEDILRHATDGSRTIVSIRPKVPGVH